MIEAKLKPSKEEIDAVNTALKDPACLAILEEAEKLELSFLHKMHNKKWLSLTYKITDDAIMVCGCSKEHDTLAEAMRLAFDRSTENLKPENFYPIPFAE